VDGDNHTGHAQVLGEKTTTGGVPTEARTYTLGHDVVAQQAETQTGTTQTSGPTLTLLYDGHGSTRSLLDGSGAVATNTVNGTAWVRMGNEAGADLSGRPGYR
jgi:hypothetical protein